MISVIVPIYNNAKYLNDCINSILIQSYKNIEIILIDDGSSDNSLDICYQYAKSDKRIIVYSQKNQGVSSARNRGISIAKGNYISFVDADDYIDSEMYQSLLNVMYLNQVDCCVMAQYNMQKYGKSLIKKDIIDNKNALEELNLLRLPTSVWAYFYKSDIIKKNKFDEKIYFFEDFKFNFDYLVDSKRIAIVNNGYYHYRNNNDGANAKSNIFERSSCLNIYDNLYAELEYLNIKTSAQYFRVHFWISNFIFLSKIKSKNVIVDNYKSVLLKYSYDMRKEILPNKYVKSEYKIIVFLYSLFPDVAIKAFQVIFKLL